MPAKKMPPARLSILFAAKSSQAVILRTGPVKATGMIHWDTSTDTFTDGQWVRHKIYAERCSLSHDGRYLIYFGYKYHGRDGAMLGGFTAISRPPYFTALTMRAQGDTWGGGGLFIDDRHVWIRSQRPDSTNKLVLPLGLRAVYHPATFAPREAPPPAGWNKRPRTFLYENGRTAGIDPANIAALDTYTRYGEWGSRIVPPLPSWCAVRDGCLFRIAADGTETLLRDFNAMEFERVLGPYPGQSQ